MQGGDQAAAAAAEAMRQQQAAQAAGGMPAPPPLNPVQGEPGHDPTRPVGRSGVTPGMVAQAYPGYLEGALPQTQGGGITINIGGPSASPSAQPGAAGAVGPGADLSSPNYLAAAQAPARPSLRESQQGMAGALLKGGFDQDVIEQLWSKNTGTRLFGGGGPRGAFG